MRLQNRCLRISSGFDRYYYVNMTHENTSTPFLNDRRNLMYKRKDRRELSNIREIRTRAHDAPLFNVPVPRCEAFKHSVSYFGSTE